MTTPTDTDTIRRLRRIDSWLTAAAEQRSFGDDGATASAHAHDDVRALIDTLQGPSLSRRTSPLTPVPDGAA